MLSVKTIRRLDKIFLKIIRLKKLMEEEVYTDSMRYKCMSLIFNDLVQEYKEVYNSENDL